MHASSTVRTTAADALAEARRTWRIYDDVSEYLPVSTLVRPRLFDHLHARFYMRAGSHLFGSFAALEADAARHCYHSPRVLWAYFHWRFMKEATRVRPLLTGGHSTYLREWEVLARACLDPESSTDERADILSGWLSSQARGLAAEVVAIDRLRSMCATADMEVLRAPDDMERADVDALVIVSGVRIPISVKSLGAFCERTCTTYRRRSSVPALYLDEHLRFRLPADLSAVHPRSDLLLALSDLARVQV